MLPQRVHATVFDAAMRLYLLKFYDNARVSKQGFFLLVGPFSLNKVDAADGVKAEHV